MKDARISSINTAWLLLFGTHLKNSRAADEKTADDKRL